MQELADNEHEVDEETGVPLFDVDRARDAIKCCLCPVSCYLYMSVQYRFLVICLILFS